MRKLYLEKVLNTNRDSAFTTIHLIKAASHVSPLGKRNDLLNKWLRDFGINTQLQAKRGDGPHKYAGIT